MKQVEASVDNCFCADIDSKYLHIYFAFIYSHQADATKQRDTIETTTMTMNINEYAEAFFGMKSDTKEILMQS